MASRSTPHTVLLAGASGLVGRALLAQLLAEPHTRVHALLRREAVQTASACRMVTQTVDAPGSSSASETYQACKGKDGNWVMTRV